MAGKKRRADTLSILNRPQLLNKIKNIDNPRDQALVAFIYLTGARISEIVGQEKKVMKFYKGKGKDRVLIRTEEVKIPPLYKENIEVLKEKDMLLVHQVVCLKRKTSVPRRTIPIIISTERDFLIYFIDYFNTIRPGEPLFPITRQRAWQIVNKELELYNHFLIHERVTHLVTNFNFSDNHLMKFRGWSNTQPAATYTHLSYLDVANKMKGGV